MGNDGEGEGKSIFRKDSSDSCDTEKLKSFLVTDQDQGKKSMLGAVNKSTFNGGVQTVTEENNEDRFSTKNLFKQYDKVYNFEDEKLEDESPRQGVKNTNDDDVDSDEGDHTFFERFILS